LIKAGDRTIRSAIRKLIWNKEWKGSIDVSICNKDDETNSSNCRGISRLSTTYKILSNTLRSRLIPDAEEITVERQCGFRYNRSTTDNVFMCS